MTSSLSVRLIAGDADDVTFEGNDNVVVVRGGLAAVGDDGEWCRYRGMVDGAGGEVRMQNINGPSRAVAKIDGIKVGKGVGLL